MNQNKIYFPILVSDQQVVKIVLLYCAAIHRCIYLWPRKEKEPGPQEVKDKKIVRVIIYHNRHKEIKFSLTAALKSLRSFSACRGYEWLNISGYTVLDVMQKQYIYTGYTIIIRRKAPCKQWK